MAPYILGLAWAYLFFLWAERSPPSRARTLWLAGLALPFALAFFRYSGTDTYALYEQIAWNSFSQGVSTGLEPGFDLLVRALMALTGSEVLTVRLLALLFTGLLALFLWRADPTEGRFLFLFFVPVFFYQYSMNAVRAGLALALVLLAWQSLRRGKWGSALGLSGLALTFHYSAFVVLLPLGLVEGLRLRKPVALGIATTFLLVAVLLFLLEREYFLNKLLLYFSQIQGVQATGEGQGLPGGSRTLMVGMLLLGLLGSPVSWGKKLAGGGLLLLLAGGSQAVALVSVAGTRLLELSALVAPLVIIRFHDLDAKRVQRGFILLMALTGLLGGAFFFRQQLRDWGGRFTGTPTPFFPYQTVFQFNPCPPSYYYPQASPRNCPFMGGDNPFPRPFHPPLPE
ncbi:MAG: EpsG family protein [Thermus sp.]